MVMVVVSYVLLMALGELSRKFIFMTSLCSDICLYLEQLQQAVQMSKMLVVSGYTLIYAKHRQWKVTRFLGNYRNVPTDYS
jgi:hypothetical protein